VAAAVAPCSTKNAAVPTIVFWDGWIFYGQIVDVVILENPLVFPVASAFTFPSSLAQEYLKEEATRKFALFPNHDNPSRFL
jgi:hypothetical protein